MSWLFGVLGSGLVQSRSLAEYEETKEILDFFENYKSNEDFKTKKVRVKKYNIKNVS